MFALGLEQVVKEPTCENSILDLLFVSEKFNKGLVQTEYGISDHKLIYFTWNQNDSNDRRQESLPILIRDFHRADDVAVIDYLETHLAIANTNVESLWELFRGAIEYCVKTFVPLRKIYKHRSNPCWINCDIIHSKRKIKRLRKQHKSSTPQFVELKQKLVTKINKARHRFFQENLEEYIRSDPIKLWRYLGSGKTKYQR